MNQILKTGDTFRTGQTDIQCRVDAFLGGGGQGEVYRVDVAGTPMAAKWFFPQYIAQDPELKSRLARIVDTESPNVRFLWPVELISTATGSFGYLMALREPRFAGINDIMTRRVDPSFRAILTASLELSDSYFQLHAKGLCYRDINFGNVFFDPSTGEIRICDNDNVDVNGRPGSIAGTPRFMAPEIVRGECAPSTETDLYSLSVLLFYLLMVHHPLDGRKEREIRCLDLPALKKLYGTEPVFIFDPEDNSNLPVPGEQDNALIFWPIYPSKLRSMFVDAFTVGLIDADRRIRETQWRELFANARDWIFYCGSCGAENFYDSEVLKSDAGRPGDCWSCSAEVHLPPRLRVDAQVIMLNHDTQLCGHHIGGSRYQFEQILATVGQNPKQPNVWGLKNMGAEKWVATSRDGAVREVEPGRSITIASGTKVHFGQVEGEFRY